MQAAQRRGVLPELFADGAPRRAGTRGTDPLCMAGCEICRPARQRPRSSKSFASICTCWEQIPRRTQPFDGSNPTLLGGYGAYGSVCPPPFAPTVLLPWYEQGGIYAWCHVRGGGEYGEERHLAGKGPTGKD